MFKKAFAGVTMAACMSAVAIALPSAAQAQTNLTMYYPVAVGGPLTKIIDGMVADFMKENPDINVKAMLNFTRRRRRPLRHVSSACRR